MSHNTVRCHSKYPGARKYRPFDNSPSDGVYWVVDVTPAGLSGLAKFLRESLHGSLAHARSSLKVRCYGRETQADVERRTNPGPKTENNIKCYDLENKQAVIEDWDFWRLEPGASPESYFNSNANRMISAGVNRVVISYAGWAENKEFLID